MITGKSGPTLHHHPAKLRENTDYIIQRKCRCAYGLWKLFCVLMAKKIVQIQRACFRFIKFTVLIYQWLIHNASWPHKHTYTQMTGHRTSNSNYYQPLRKYWWSSSPANPHQTVRLQKSKKKQNNPPLSVTSHIATTTFHVPNAS